MIWISILYVLIIVAGLIFIYQKRQEEERYFGWKLIGYFLLGTFSFYFDTFAIPVGFFIFLFFMRPKVNKKIKTYAAVFGLAMFLMNIASQYAEHYWFERPRSIDLTTDNVFDLSIIEHYERLQKKAEISDEAVLQDYTVAFTKTGELLRFDVDFVDEIDETSHIYYWLEFDKEGQKISVRKEKHEGTYFHHENSAPVKPFLKMLDSLPFEKIASDEEYEKFELFGGGYIQSIAMVYHDKYLIVEGDFKKVDNQNLPIDTYWMVKSGAKKLEGDSRCELQAYYLIQPDELLKYE
ncbi:hypothetical protein [Bacillus sp. FJAT-47783]|uniref:hypothetical protein n=1 Tax=Bacillus sp. FJAT-47783 TaxID=2922712 RepID=UPI001FAC33B5|nr:hypothetical protein [Bacillus sp. FJAT-47783]